MQRNGVTAVAVRQQVAPAKGLAAVLIILLKDHAAAPELGVAADGHVAIVGFTVGDRLGRHMEHRAIVIRVGRVVPSVAKGFHTRGRMCIYIEKVDAEIANGIGVVQRKLLAGLHLDELGRPAVIPDRAAIGRLIGICASVIDRRRRRGSIGELIAEFLREVGVFDLSHVIEEFRLNIVGIVQDAAIAQDAQVKIVLVQNAQGRGIRTRVALI